MLELVQVRGLEILHPLLCFPVKEVNSLPICSPVQSSSLYLTNWFCSIISVPIKAVDSVTVEWTSVSSVLVAWTPLSYIEARGFPLYLITYKSDDGSTSGSVNTTSSSVAITGLDHQYVYIFTVQISTGNGKNKGGTEFGEHVSELLDGLS